MTKTKIMIIEDDELAAFFMEDFLRDCGFLVEVYHTVTDGLSHIKHSTYDVLLLDLNLPDFNGLDLIKTLKNNYALSIMVISAYSDTPTKIKAFKYGASDYMVKPVDFEELEVRIWSLLGRHSEISLEKQNNIFELKDFNIFFKNNVLELTSIEYEILKSLILNKNQTLSRNELAKSLSSISSHRTLDHHIKNIRIKLHDDGSKPTYLKTEYGVGYKLVF